MVAVQHYPGCNLTALAVALGVSKAATSKFVTKLVRYGYLDKCKAHHNRRDVLFELTEIGLVAARGYERFERETFGPLLQVEKGLSPEARASVIDYFRKLTALVD